MRLMHHMGVFKFIFLGLFCLATIRMEAAHIIGGEMYYQCQGYGKNGTDSTSRRYKITIELYRDKFGNGAGFDTPLGYTIYRKVKNNYEIYKINNRNEVNVNLNGAPNLIQNPTYKCLVLPGNIGVEVGIYESYIDLPIYNDEYVIVWQRCCRNYTITNIVSPNSTGVTYTISISAEAQLSCNSSPRFKNFPPTVVCVNNPLSFDHSAIDDDGDLLIYDLCAPLHGGGLSNIGCDMIIPNPDCPPPFEEVNFRLPYYSPQNPMGGNPAVTINSITGLITGEPNDVGQFVVGVCVHEYRNGILLSTVQRDFQFNVAICQGTVVAELGGGKKIGRREYEFLVCNSDSFSFNNKSYLQNFISGIQWQYENNGGIDSSDKWSPSIKFDTGGIHIGKIYLNPGLECSDSLFYSIRLVPDLKADFTVNFDTCLAGPVSFVNNSSSSASTIKEFSWSLGDGFTSNNPDASIQYVRPGKYQIGLAIEDQFGCIQKANRILEYYPAPKILIFDPNHTEGCIPLEVSLRNISFPTDSSYKLQWEFSDGAGVTGGSIRHQFDSIGTYDVKLKVTSPLGCYNEAEFKNVFRVYPPPVAGYTLDSTRINLKNAVINLVDTSRTTTGRSWLIDSLDFYFDKELRIQFDRPGWHTIDLIAVDKYLCTDTVQARVFVYENFTIFMPTAFSPNGDGTNEEFKPVGQFPDLEKYSLSIFDRWGARVFQTDQIGQGWNGKMQNEGNLMPAGVYIYHLTYQRRGEKESKTTNTVTLLR